MEQKGPISGEDTVCSSPQQGQQSFGASDLAPMESPRSPVAGRPLGWKASCHLANCGRCPGSSWEAGGKAVSSWLPSCLVAAQMARLGCPAGPSEDNSTQGEGSAAHHGHCWDVHGDKLVIHSHGQRRGMWGRPPAGRHPALLGARAGRRQG